MLEKLENIPDKPSECLNCGKLLFETHEFCPNCGQKTHFKRLETKPIINEAIGKLLELDEGGFLRTFRGLMLSPGKVCIEYVMGKRKVYMKPIPYFIIPVIIYIFISQYVDISFWEQFHAGLTNGEDVDGSSKVYFDYLLKAIKDQRIFFFASIPAMSIAYSWLFRKKVKLNFAEHMVFNLFTQGHAIILKIPFALIAILIEDDFVVLGYIVGYTYFLWSIKQFYSTSILKAIWAYFVGAVVYYVLLLTGITIFLIVAEIAVR